MSDPQDVAESLDETVTGGDDVDPVPFDGAPERPFAAEEEIVVEPITDSVAGRDRRSNPELDDDDDGHDREDEARLYAELTDEDDPVIGDDEDLSAEEAALHLERPR